MPFIRIGWWHPDISHDDIGACLLNRRPQCVQIAAGCYQVELVHRLKKLSHSFPDEEAVVGEHNPDGHGARIGLAPPL